MSNYGCFNDLFVCMGRCMCNGVTLHVYCRMTMAAIAPN